MEQIQCAAIRWFDDHGNATIIWGYQKNLNNRHDLIRDFMMAHNKVHGSMLFKKAEQGFLTTTGRFVRRREALEIAFKADQIFHKHADYNILYSEDMRPCVAEDHTWCFEYRKAAA